MAVAAKEKAQLVTKFGTNAKDTGATEVQVAILSTDINSLTEHLKIHKKDVHSRRGLIQKVSSRRRLLDYLKRKHNERYQTIIQELDLRK